MLLRHRKAYQHWQRDWQTAEQRMAGATVTEQSTVVVWAKGVCAVGMALLMLWLLWQMTGDAAQAFFYRLAGG